MLSNDRLKEMYVTMVRIRRFEEKVCAMLRAGTIPGAAHPYIGEEAIAVGVCSALKPDDYIASTHRGHGHCIAKGLTMDRMMAELYGKATGYNHGKGGSMHIADFSRGMLGANGIVGAGVAIASGAAWASQALKQGRVAVAFFGDGALNRGALHEAFNMASIWKLPVVYVCENNHWAVSVPTSYAMAIDDPSTRAVGYGIPGASLDGNDVIAVHEAATQAVGRARRGEGPTFLVCNTTRMLGHTAGDAQVYRPKSDIEDAAAKDPIPRLARRLLSENIMTQEDVAAVELFAQEEIAAAIRFAESSPDVRPEDALTDLFEAV